MTSDPAPSSVAVVTVCTPARAGHLWSQRRALAAHLPDARHVVVSFTAEV